jgi:hypothetical protein
LVATRVRCCWSKCKCKVESETELESAEQCKTSSSRQARSHNKARRAVRGASKARRGVGNSGERKGEREREVCDKTEGWLEGADKVKRGSLTQRRVCKRARVTSSGASAYANGEVVKGAKWC